MLQEISVKNLACFDDKEYAVDFSEETLLAGPNNSGKSMLLAAMNLLRNLVVTGSVAWNTSYYRFQSFEASVHNHEQDSVIFISIKLKEAMETYVFDLELSYDGRMELKVNNTGISISQPPQCSTPSWAI